MKALPEGSTLLSYGIDNDLEWLGLENKRDRGVRCLSTTLSKIPSFGTGHLHFDSEFHCIREVAGAFCRFAKRESPLQISRCSEALLSYRLPMWELLPR